MEYQNCITLTPREVIEVIKQNYPPQHYSLLREALDMSIELLEKASPHIISLDDLYTTQFDSYIIEDHSNSQIYITSRLFYTSKSRQILFEVNNKVYIYDPLDYNITWRMWDKEPTEKDREQEPWIINGDDK